MVHPEISRSLSLPGSVSIIMVQNGATSPYAIIFMAISPSVKETKKQRKKFLNFLRLSILSNGICMLPHKKRLIFIYCT